MPTPISGGANFSNYPIGGSISDIGQGASSDAAPAQEFWSLDKLKRAYLDYLGTKREEIDEQQDARRMRHGSQWTSQEINQLNQRKQPVVTNNRISRKIHGVIGTLGRLKQDPKAFPRTPEHEQGAELATAVIRYVLDNQNWDAADPIAAEFAAVDGIGGVEFNLSEADQGDPDVEIEIVNPDSFFYDPRSFKADFSDARYMGVGKWLDLDSAVELFPDHEQDLRAQLETGSELTSEPDRDEKWFQSDDIFRRIRIVECWYKLRGEWVWSIFTGAMTLMEGPSYLRDEDGKSIPKYVMFSAYIDHDGDRYGFVRDLKPLQREINMRRSKALYTMLSRRILAPKGSFDDVERARREASRSDGVVEYNLIGQTAPSFDDSARAAETQAQFSFLEDVKTDLESFGPNISITGEGLERSSGRAISLLQQAGLSDLGPFLLAYRGWKIRIYRAVWNTIKQHWTAERWIRVTDDEDVAEFIQINGLQRDPFTGAFSWVNALGELDVDIILDEGPDTINQTMDAFDTLTALAQRGTEIPPDVLLELAPLPGSLKKRLLEKLNPEPTPEQEQRAQTELRHGQATVADKEASAQQKQTAAQLNLAKAFEALQALNQPESSIELPEMPDPAMRAADLSERLAGVEEKRASATLKSNQAMKAALDTRLEPFKMAQDFEFQRLKYDNQRNKANAQ